jgi:hypothetical protein
LGGFGDGFPLDLNVIGIALDLDELVSRSFGDGRGIEIGGSQPSFDPFDRNPLSLFDQS